MLIAAGVLFYVSYWLISQSESKRWMAFLKRQAERGMSSGPWGSFALLSAAFLAVYREGAETALMYQAMIGSQAGSRLGVTGLAAGLGVGLVVLAMVACLIWATSVRLPLRAFFQATGAVLFAMAVVFAGNGVHELQASSILKITPLTWLGAGLPVLGMHPNVQVLSVQAVLLAGALLALIVLTLDEPVETPLKSGGAGGKPAAGVGV
jgi:high-affinity iron transporter